MSSKIQKQYTRTVIIASDSEGNIRHHIDLWRKGAGVRRYWKGYLKSLPEVTKVTIGHRLPATGARFHSA